ncbi:MAG: DUF3536 domain-containing protein [Stenomitos rutilans HA7619-LM2]|jgi:alpha-amylase/alpha-mannosidase (GH57 family)|nr:DUF3536 domain-containing protein [Stenomitos rutilans HA7619-LM2]
MTSNFDPRFAASATRAIADEQSEHHGNHSTQDDHRSDDRTGITAAIDRPHSDLLKTAQGVYVTVHGHFYQPPRENPYLDAIERQPSAAPFHNWNERIHHECYRPNAFARILNEQGDVIEIVNNYEFLSFNIGPTLMNWLERHDIETYQRILEADRKSCARLNGHGNAIAQAYNHIILPLANDRDKLTQIRWGKADFHSRFGRDPEGMWLAETAVDYATLEALVSEGIKFIVLAPSQAQRCRPMPTNDQPIFQWLEVGGGQIDPTRPYRCFLKDQEAPTTPHSPLPTPFIDIFFYDGPISRDMGFDSALSSSYNLVGRLGQAVRGDQRPSQLISVATDGETFGHHKGGTEKCLAYAFRHEFVDRGWTATNFAHYLSLQSPTWEVELKHVTAWSCSHGVDRWQHDCGCGGGGLWNQQWRRPLRDALDWLRDQLAKVYEEAGRKLFCDPWLARDEYIQVVRDRSLANLTRFFTQHQTHKLTVSERVDALHLLEMQRHALLMYTSCGWFFDELSRPEGVQILRYAARALELAGEVTGIQLEKAFVRRLALAPSNVDCFQDGADVYRQLVKTAQISIEQVAAHYAISSLFTTYSKEHQVYCYTANQLDYQLQRMGSLTLAVGQLQLVSDITRESTHLLFAVVHLGGWDFHCCIQPFSGRRDYAELKDQLFESIKQASAAQTIMAMNALFNYQAHTPKTYSLQSLFAEERHRIMRLLTHETLTRLDQLYTQVYRDNYGVLMAFHRDELAVPQELQVAAAVALDHRVSLSLRALEQEMSEPTADASSAGTNRLLELETIATEADHLHCQLNQPEARQALERLVLRSLWQLLYHFDPAISPAELHRLERLLALGNQMKLDLSLAQAQELYFQRLQTWLIPECRQWLSHAGQFEVDRASTMQLADLRSLLQLGQKLAVDVNGWLHQLP